MTRSNRTIPFDRAIDKNITILTGIKVVHNVAYAQNECIGFFNKYPNRGSFKLSAAKRQKRQTYDFQFVTYLQDQDIFGLHPLNSSSVFVFLNTARVTF